MVCPFFCLKGVQNLKVGIVGPGSSCRIIERNIREIDQSIKVKNYPSEQVNTSAEAAEKCDGECDALRSSPKWMPI